MHFNHYQIQEAMVSVKDRLLSFKVFSFCAFSCLKQLLIWLGCRESFIWSVLWVIFFSFMCIFQQCHCWISACWGSVIGWKNTWQTLTGRVILLLDDTFTEKRTHLQHQMCDLFIFFVPFRSLVKSVNCLSPHKRTHGWTVGTVASCSSPWQPTVHRN